MNVRSPPPVTTGTPFDVRVLAPPPVRLKKNSILAERTGVYAPNVASRSPARGAGRGLPESGAIPMAADGASSP